MDKHNTKPAREKLVAMLQTKGWDLVTGSPTFPIKDRSLEELVRASHARHSKGESPGLIRRMEDSLELSLIQLQELWEYLGLPV